MSHCSEVYSSNWGAIKNYVLTLDIKHNPILIKNTTQRRSWRYYRYVYKADALEIANDQLQTSNIKKIDFARRSVASNNFCSPENYWISQCKI